MRRLAFALPFILVAAGAAFAQPAHQVADLNTTQEDITDPLFTGEDFAVLGTTVFFLADDDVHGVELWKTDGTAAGTSLVKDICPGGCWGRPEFLTVWNGALYFAADDGVHGYEPWRSDGTAAGTTMVKDINPGLPGSAPKFLAAGGILYLSADDGAHGRELWRTDGTAAGTVMVADLQPGPVGSDPRLWLDTGDGRLLINADDGVHGREPWLTDGTPSGTTLLADINPGAGDSSLAVPVYNVEADALTLGGGAFLFQVDDGVHGFELWKSDGTTAGTALLVDIDPGSGSSYAHGFTRLGSQILFAATDGTAGVELWTTDGTPNGTALLKDINPGAGNSSPAQLTPLGSQLFFAANDGTTGVELWKTDGTNAGTVLVKDINPMNGSLLTGNGFNLFARTVLKPFAGGLLFFADDGTHGVEPWKTDGTSAGTVLVKDVEPGAGDGAYGGYAGITVVGGTAFFQGVTQAHGAEIWKTDGTDAGTVEVKDIQTLASSIPAVGDVPISGGSGTGNFQILGSKLLFGATDGVSGVEPWVSDGTAAGTVQLADLIPGSAWGGPVVYDLPVGGTRLLVSEDGSLWTTDGTPAGTQQLFPAATLSGSNFTPALGTVFFAGQDASAGTELWKTDGTAAGTVRIGDLAPGANGSYPSLFTPFGSAVLFAAQDGGPTLPKLWRTDGTPAGTLELTTGSITNIQWIVPVGSLALFAADVSGAGQELCVTDGTAGGTQMLKDLRAGAASSSPQRPVLLGGVVVFSAFDDATGQELWASDGTAAGTVLLKDINPGAASGFTPYLAANSGNDQAVIGNTLYFLADDGTTGNELWKTDGTPGGTVLVKDIFPGARSSDIDWMTVAEGRLFFVADDGVHGRELWVSDGTTAGTRMVMDIFPGAGSSVIRNVRAIGHLVLFSADDGVHGHEPWRSDGSAVGTFLVQDIAPGSAPSNPLDFTAAGGTVYFAADDNVAGTELWAAPQASLFATFQDVPADFFAWRFIEALTIQGVTSGCGGGRFCPDSSITRAEAAVFLLAARDDTPPPAATGTRFQDVPLGFWAGPWIEELAREGVITGCSASPPLYCPNDTLTRAQMAILIVGARHETPPPATGTRFNDVPAGYWAARWIEQLAADGITGGCGGGNFCPDQPITRAEMAVFLATAFHLPLP
jgi:trimeric autotransporter adhesin